VTKYLLVFLPSRLKIAVLRRMGAKIGKRCFVGFSVVEAKQIVVGDDVHIGHFNLMWRLEHLRLESGSLVGSFNWITGANSGHLVVGGDSAITDFHYLEASAGIRIGANCVLAGRSSHFFTHGISSTNLDDRRPIHIGDWCYIGSGSRFVPGSGVAVGTFVGMGSVVTKDWSEEYVLLAGAPAKIRKTLSPEDAYFDRPYHPHSHHSAKHAGKFPKPPSDRN
jgi:acetyltransferase-like isoleucine patch superfamily enzyme